MKSRRRQVLVASAVALALWPVWGWYARRTVDSSDEPWGLLALATLVALDFVPSPCRSVREEAARGLLLPAAILLAYAATFPFVPPLASAVLGLMAMAGTASALWPRLMRCPGAWGLLLLSLPALPSLQFFTGYPLRWGITSLTASLLQMNGMGVKAQGASLQWGGQWMAVDPPCSGVHMLWAMLYLALAVATWECTRLGRTVLLAAVAVAAALAANVVRMAALFHAAAAHVPFPSWGHEAVGLVCLGGAAVVFLVAASWGQEARRRPLPGFPPGEEPPPAPRPARAVPVLGFLVICVLAGMAPLLPPPAWATPGQGAFPGWPASIAGLPLAQGVTVRSDAGEIVDRWPGIARTFHVGSETVLVRWVGRASRAVHPAADCYRGAAWTVDQEHTVQDARGYVWHAFVAERGGRKLRVREGIVDASGQMHADVSEWYWAAWSGRSRGPWWAVTVVQVDHRTTEPAD